MDMLRIKLADFDQLFHLDNSDFPGHCDIGVEIACGLAKNQIAAFVSDISFDQRHIGHDRPLHHILTAIKFACFLALSYHGASTCGSKECRNTRTPCAQTLCKGPLRSKLYLYITGQILTLELLVLADIRRDHLAHLPGVERLPEPVTIDTCIITHPSYIFNTGFSQCSNQGLGNNT